MESADRNIQYAAKNKKYRIQRTKRTNRRNMIDFAVLPTFSTSYTLERSTSNMSIMPEVGPVAKTAQVEIVMQKAVARLSFLKIRPTLSQSQGFDLNACRDVSMRLFHK